MVILLQVSLNLFRVIVVVLALKLLHRIFLIGINHFVEDSCLLFWHVFGLAETHEFEIAFVARFADFRFKFFLELAQTFPHTRVPVVLDCIVGTAGQNVGDVSPLLLFHAVLDVQDPLLVLGP